MRKMTSDQKDDFTIDLLQKIVQKTTEIPGPASPDEAECHLAAHILNTGTIASAVHGLPQEESQVLAETLAVVINLFVRNRRGLIVAPMAEQPTTDPAFWLSPLSVMFTSMVKAAARELADDDAPPEAYEKARAAAIQAAAEHLLAASAAAITDDAFVDAITTGRISRDQCLEQAKHLATLARQWVVVKSEFARR